MVSRIFFSFGTVIQVAVLMKQNIFLLLLFLLPAGCSEQPAASVPAPRPKLPAGQALAELLENGGFTGPRYTLTSNPPPNRHMRDPNGKYPLRWFRVEYKARRYFAGFFTRGKDAYLFSYPLGDDLLLWINYLGSDIRIQRFRTQNGYFMLDYTAADGTHRKSGVPFADVVDEYPGDDGAFAPDGRQDEDDEPAAGKYQGAGFSRLQEPTIENFIPNFKELVRNDDVDAIADMLYFPLETTLEFDGRKILYIAKNKKDFKRNYSRIFHPEFKRDILQLDDRNFSFCGMGIYIDETKMRLIPGTGAKIVIVELHN